MVLEEAIKIAEDYRNKNFEYYLVLYRGEFGGGYLFRLNFNGTGHHGTPLFFIVNHDGSILYLKEYSHMLDKAWSLQMSIQRGIRTCKALLVLNG